MATDIPSARSFLRKWVREQVMELDEVSVTELAAEAITYLRNHNLMEDFTREVVGGMVAIETRHTFGIMRRESHQVGDLILTGKALDARANRLKDKAWPSWMRAPEWIGDGHIAPLRMHRAELLLAADIRDKRGSREMRLGELWRSLADRLETVPTLMVGEVMTPEEVEALRKQVLGDDEG